MMEEKTAKLVAFGRGGDTVYFSKGHTCTGYGTPEKPHAAQAKNGTVIPDGTPVIDMTPAVNTTEGFRWAIKTPMVNVDLPEEGFEECPIPSTIMEYGMAGTDFGSLLTLQKASKRIKPTNPAPLDYVGIKTYIDGWRDHGARIGTYQNGEIVWEDDRNHCQRCDKLDCICE